MAAALIHRGPDDEGIWTDPLRDLGWPTVGLPSLTCRRKATSQCDQ